MEQAQPSNSVKGITMQYCCLILEQLKRYLITLHQEAQHLHNIEEDYNHKQAVFYELNQAFNSKLSYLWAISDRSNRKKNIHNYLLQLTKSWKEAEEKLAQESSSVPIVSRTAPDVLLPAMLEKLQYLADSAKFTFQTIPAHYACSRNAAYLYSEMMFIISRLSSCSTTVHYSLLLSKLVPYLKELDAVIDSLAKSSLCSPEEATAQAETKHEQQENFLIPPARHDPFVNRSGAHIPEGMFNVDSNTARFLWHPRPPPFAPGLRFQRLFKPVPHWVSPVPSQQPPPPPPQRDDDTSAEPMVNIKVEPSDPDADPMDTTKLSSGSGHGAEEECDLMPIKIPRLETSLFTPLP